MTIRAALFAFCAGGLLVCPQELYAQTAPEHKPHIPLEKSLGQAKPEVVPSLFVLNSRGASLKNGKLVLTGISPNAIVFADRPVRAAGHDLTTRIVEDWGNGSDNFAKDPPNATVSGFKKDGSSVIDAVVVLKSPRLEDDKLTFDVDILEGDLVGADGPASVLSTSLADRSLRCPLRASPAERPGAVPSTEVRPSRERPQSPELRPIRTTHPGVDTILICPAIELRRRAAS
jgi:hypothetical protein